MFPNAGRIKENDQSLANQQLQSNRDCCTFYPGVIVIDLPVPGADGVEFIFGVDVCTGTYSKDNELSLLGLSLLRHS